MGKDGRNAKRITTTFTKAQHEALLRIADKNGVDVAWLIRRAVDRLIEDAEGGPLLPFRGETAGEEVNMRGLELFSGCGGLALGTARAGFEHVRLVEWNVDACATLALNKRRGVEHARDWDFVQGDVRKMAWKEIQESVDLVAGGPPCQPFSIGGKHRGNDDARDMWPEAIRAVRELRPRAFLFENVKGLLRPAFADYLEWITTYLTVPMLGKWAEETHAQHLKRLRDYLARADYSVIVLKVNAADYGAPQKRHRVVLAGVRRDLDLRLPPPLPTHSREALLWDQWVSGRYWEHHGLPKPTNDPTSATDKRMVDAMRTTGARPATKAWVTVRDAVKGLGFPNGDNGHVFQDGARTYVGHTGSPLDEPAKALKAGDHGVPGGENMMVRGRRVSPLLHHSRGRAAARAPRRLGIRHILDRKHAAIRQCSTNSIGGGHGPLDWRYPNIFPSSSTSSRLTNTMVSETF